MQTLLSDYTFGVNSCGNTEALQMCLASVLNASVLPKAIQIRFEGHLPSFGRFYMEQLSELARFRGVEFTMSVAKSEGVRAARDWQLANCKTDFLWMGDDDVVYAYDCLEYLSKGATDILKRDDQCAYICGVKGDLNNRRGWGNFQMKIHKKEDVHDNCAFNWFYDKEDCAKLYPRIWTCDTGNVLINLPLVRSKDIRFTVFEESLNSGGEDTIFALECGHAGLTAYFVPSAHAFHLEKPVVNFNEHAARAEMVLRVADLRGYSGEQMDYVRKIFMPWCFEKA
jgi:hypothetical protein